MRTGIQKRDEGLDLLWLETRTIVIVPIYSSTGSIEDSKCITLFADIFVRQTRTLDLTEDDDEMSCGVDQWIGSYLVASSFDAKD